MEREIYIRLAVVLASKAIAEAPLEDGPNDDDIEKRAVEFALLQAKQYAHLAAKIWGKE
jgi:hypothetical protein